MYAHTSLAFIITRVALFSLFLLALCTLARAIMVAHFLPSAVIEAHLSDFGAMWFMGFKLDMRSIGIAMIIFSTLALFGTICYNALKLFLNFASKATRGGAIVEMMKQNLKS